MDGIKEKLKKREEYLLQLRAEKEKALLDVPGGALRVCNSGGKLQYYQRNSAKDTSGIYISKKNIELAKKLAQKDYDERALYALKKELAAIQKYQNSYPAVCVEQVYERLHEGRQRLVIPVSETEEQFVDRWEQVKYHGKDFDMDAPEFYTEKGERVRSKSEVIIADALYRRGVPYRYEYPIYLQGIGKVYPDFTVLNVKARKEMHWEHFGMMDDSVYAEKAVRKINGYIQNGQFVGDKMIFTYETKSNPINLKQIGSVICQYLL